MRVARLSGPHCALGTLWVPLGGAFLGQRHSRCLAQALYATMTGNTLLPSAPSLYRSTTITSTSTTPGSAAWGC